MKRESAPANCAISLLPSSITTRREKELLDPHVGSSSPNEDVARWEEESKEKRNVDEEDNKSLLSLGDCLENGWEGVSRLRSSPELGEKEQEVKLERGDQPTVKRTKDAKAQEILQLHQNMQPFPSMDVGLEEDPLKKEERKGARQSFTQRHEELSDRGIEGQQAKAEFVLEKSLEAGLNSTSTKNNADLETTSYTYSPFIPLVFQHERLQQKLKVPVPIVEFQGGTEECEIECVVPYFYLL